MQVSSNRLGIQYENVEALSYLPAGFHTATVHLTVNGAAEYIEFLKRAFDAVEVTRSQAADGRLLNACLRIADSAIMLNVDDNPSEQRVWLTAFARYCGALEPPHVSEQQALQAAGPDAVYYATRLRGASNAKAKRELGFRPRPLQWLANTAGTAHG